MLLLYTTHSCACATFRPELLPRVSANMICIILVAGHGVLLEEEISSQVGRYRYQQTACTPFLLVPTLSFLHTQQDPSGTYSHLVGVPKALLPASSDKYGDTILDCWWKALKRSLEHVLLTTTCLSKVSCRWLQKANLITAMVGGVATQGRHRVEKSGEAMLVRPHPVYKYSSEQTCTCGNNKRACIQRGIQCCFE